MDRFSGGLRHHLYSETVYFAAIHLDIVQALVECSDAGGKAATSRWYRECVASRTIRAHHRREQTTAGFVCLQYERPSSIAK